MKLRPEAELAVLCASPSNHAGRVKELLEQKLDWDYLLRFVANQRLQQVFVWRLREARKLNGTKAVPQALGNAFDETLRNSLQLTRELVRVVELFRAHGIDALPFKGPTLALEGYGNLALRSFDDLDILVRREDVWRARDILQQAGYQPKVNLKPAREADFLRSYDEFLLRGPGGFPLIELHWAFVPPHFAVELGFDECWQRRGRVKLANRELPVLHPEDLLLVLSVHGAKHGWAYLGLVADVAWLLGKRAFAWPQLLEAARARGILRMVLLAVALASRVFEMELDPVLARAIEADSAVERLVLEITESIFELNGRTPHNERAIMASAKLHMRMRERARDRVRYALRLGLRAGIEDWQAIDLPAPLGFLYPVLRLPRLVKKYRSGIP